MSAPARPEASEPASVALAPAGARVHAALRDAAAALRADDLHVPEPRGQLLRPLVGWAVLDPPARGSVDDRFWYGLLAIQMVHEASLLHDDLIDEADTRRGRPTVRATRGAAAALVEGDHLLTSAYRVAAATGSPTFMTLFARAVERTVAGEIAQQRAAGRRLDPAEYRRAIEGKSGELFGATVAWARLWTGRGGAGGIEPGRSVGALYQMVDDALDYCPVADTGKEPLQDYRQQKWTFVLDHVAACGFDAPPEAIVHRVFEVDDGAASVRVVERLQSERVSVVQALQPADGLLDAILGGWVARVEAAYARQVERSRVERVETSAVDFQQVTALARAVGSPKDWGDYFAHHSRSFRFASRLFPEDARRSIEGVYAFCRFTDDLVDEATGGPDEARRRVAVWRSLAAEAYRGNATGVPLSDHVMGEAARRGVPFHYIDDLLAGVESDLDPVRFSDEAELRRYTYRVASVVGGWITELFGVHDPRLLARAFELGHAMQLTNILRDVGEDWRQGRVYLPRTLLRRHQVSSADLESLSDGGPLPEHWAALCEELMAEADRSYEAAFEALPELPGFYARPVAVAARVYQGIHEAIRRNHYDNGTLRAHTGRVDKLRLGWRGLRELRSARLAVEGAPAPAAVGFQLAAHDGATT
ncbi:squalene/phytoene synthase family protein [Gemmatimonadota bacterium Y43]|uniref:squalene/phytoene synthase family protein n=1 Tax=Gaopeijia maritima TaxID=3119007 RepID=UPI00328F765C